MKPWFKRIKPNWRFYPITWQGWMVIVVYVLIVVVDFIIFNPTQSSASPNQAFGFIGIIDTIFLFLVIFLKSDKD